MQTAGRLCLAHLYRGLLLAALMFMGFAALLAGPVQAKPLAEVFGNAKLDSSTVVDHGPWSQLLGAFVVAGSDGINRVRYADFKRDGHAKLKAYIRYLEAVDVAGLNRAGQMAFWANLYNAKTIDIVLDAYPVKSIKDIRLGGGLVAAVTGGPWKAKVLNVANQSLSLDDIEHAILRPIFKDPRVHYAVNCASIGCPNLMQEAFTADALDARLDTAARAYVNHGRGLNVTGGALNASSIYNWFSKDFGGEKGVLEHARKFANPELLKKLEGISAISGYDYDWSLNDAGQQTRD